MPACVERLARRGDRTGGRAADDADHVLLATNFCATVCAAEGPCSTGASPGDELDLQAHGLRQRLDRELRPGELLLAEEACTTRERREHADLERARAADRARALRSSRSRAPPTPSPRALSPRLPLRTAETTWLSSCTNSFSGGTGHTKPRADRTEKAGICWRARRRRSQAAVSASTQPRVSVNWWKRTALPSANFQTCANGTSSGLPGGLGARRVAADRDDVVVAREQLGGRGVEVLPPLLVDRVEDGGAHGRQAVVDAAVRRPWAWCQTIAVVHHGQRSVEVAAGEGLVRTADRGEVFGRARTRTADSTFPPSVINYQRGGLLLGARRTAGASPTAACRRSRPRRAS